MKHVNVIWPQNMEEEYLRLFGEFCDNTTEEVLADEIRFDQLLDDYFQRKASPSLKEWLEKLNKLENRPA